MDFADLNLMLSVMGRNAPEHLKPIIRDCQAQIVERQINGLPDLERSEIDEFYDNNKINAIKMYRDRTHCTLSEAKLKVEDATK